MHTMHETEGLNLGAAIAAVVAAGLVGLLALMLSGVPGTGGGTDLQVDEPAPPQGARYPIVTEKFAPGRFDVTTESAETAAYPTPCHGEGLMDTAIQELLLGENETVAQYCEPKAHIAGEPDTVDPETDSTYPEDCQGEGLIVPMDPAAQNDGPGSLAEFCTSDAGSEDEPQDGQLFPGGSGLTKEEAY